LDGPEISEVATQKGVVLLEEMSGFSTRDLLDAVMTEVCPFVRTGDRRRQAGKIMTPKRKHKLVIALCLVVSAFSELALLGRRTTAKAHEIATLDGNRGLAAFELSAAPLHLVRMIPVTNGQEILGVIAIYDDPMTRRAEDYLELRDDAGQIVAIEWFDQFGIRRLTLDRGFLTGKGKFEKIFATLVSGKPL
jgi:hypothetical protein